MSGPQAVKDKGDTKKDKAYMEFSRQKMQLKKRVKELLLKESLM